MCSRNSVSTCTNILPSNLVGEWSNISKHTRDYENTHHSRILETVQMVGFCCEGHFIEHKLGAFVEHT